MMRELPKRMLMKYETLTSVTLEMELEKKKEKKKEEATFRLKSAFFS